MLRWALLGSCLLVASTLGCTSSGAEKRASSEPPDPAAVSSGELVLLVHGDQPTFEMPGVSQQSGMLSEEDGCVSLRLPDGKEFLLYAPYGSLVEASSPRIRLSGGYPGFDIGNEVEVDGLVKDVWRASGRSKPIGWQQCVGGPSDHQLMFVVVPKQS